MEQRGHHLQRITMSKPRRQADQGHRSETLWTLRSEDLFSAGRQYPILASRRSSTRPIYRCDTAPEFIALVVEYKRLQRPRGLQISLIVSADTLSEQQLYDYMASTIQATAGAGSTASPYPTPAGGKDRISCRSRPRQNCWPRASRRSM